MFSWVILLHYFTTFFIFSKTFSYQLMPFKPILLLKSYFLLLFLFQSLFFSCFSHHLFFFLQIFLCFFTLLIVVRRTFYILLNQFLAHLFHSVNIFQILLEFSVALFFNNLCFKTFFVLLELYLFCSLFFFKRCFSAVLKSCFAFIKFFLALRFYSSNRVSQALLELSLIS